MDAMPSVDAAVYCKMEEAEARLLDDTVHAGIRDSSCLPWKARTMSYSVDLHQSTT